MKRGALAVAEAQHVRQAERDAVGQPQETKRACFQAHQRADGTKAAEQSMDTNALTENDVIRHVCA